MQMMSCRRYPSKSLQILLLSSFVYSMITVELATEKDEGFIKSKKDGNEKKKKAPAKSTGYKTSEVIEKAPSEDHPCKLIRTSERITFPALKN